MTKSARAVKNFTHLIYFTVKDKQQQQHNNNNNHFTALCSGLLGWASTARSIHPLMYGHLWGDTCHLQHFMVQGEDKRGRHTNNPAGHHPIWTISVLTSIIPTIFTLDALPAATLPIYPGLGQAPSMVGLHTWWLSFTVNSPQSHLGRAALPPFTAENGLTCCVHYYLCDAHCRRVQSLSC